MTYAVLNYTRKGSVLNSISTGIMTMSYTEDENKISIENATPTEEMILDIGTIKNKVSYKYRLRLWLSKDYSTTSESKSFSLKVNVYGKNGTITRITSPKKESAAEKIVNLAKTDKTNLAYDETVDNNLRYIGANPNNYVSFNVELWRIIGVMNNIDDGTGTKETRGKLVKDGYVYIGIALDSSDEEWK